MRIMSAPNPRYRIYGGLNNYFSPLKDFVLGKKAKGVDDIYRFEDQVKKYIGVEHAICVPQNRVGVYLTIKSLIRPGQQVIMSPYTIVDIVNMVILAGGRPLFADIERETCNINAQAVKFLLEESEDVGAVLVTHLHGLAAPTHEILHICEAHGVPLIEDAAQGFGAQEHERKLGTIGHAGIFSFGMYKNVNTWFGGAVVTHDLALAQKIRAELDRYKYQGWGSILGKMKQGLMTDLATLPALFKALTFWIFRFGLLHDVEAINRLVRIELDSSRKQTLDTRYLTRMTPSQARLGLSQLHLVDQHSNIRIQNARIYHDGLCEIPELVIPPLRDDFSHIYTYFPIQYEQRDELLKWAMAHNRDIAAQHYKNCADLPSFQEFNRDCPNARAIANQLIFLPTYPRYGERNVRRNVEIIRSYFKRGPGQSE